MIKYIQYADGRLGNQLYYILQSYIQSHGDIRVKYVFNKNEYKEPYYEFLSELGCSEYFTTEDISCNRIWDYKQKIGIDFTESQLNDFIDNVILKSKLYQDITPITDTVVIHIRNTDYFISRLFDCFDRMGYIKYAISKFKNIKKAHIISDDINVSKIMFDKILSENFETITYSNNIYYKQDFIDISKYTNRILWNSTFSFWASFIGDRLYPDSKVVVPRLMTALSPTINHKKQNWII